MQQTIYKTVTGSIIASLESGVAPWVRPWNAAHSADCNAVSGNAYKGVNRLILAAAFKPHASNATEGHADILRGSWTTEEVGGDDV